MSESTRRKIKQLRALAASTTFPEEAKSARAKADQLEATMGDPRANDDHGPNARARAGASQASIDDIAAFMRNAAEMRAMNESMFEAMFNAVQADLLRRGL